MKRLYPNYLNGAAPTLPALSDMFQMGATLKGMVPLPRISRDQDPDSATATYPDLYIHPKMPGLLFKPVSSVRELFTLGSSFIVGRKEGATVAVLGYWGVVGARAEQALLGNKIAPATFTIGEGSTAPWNYVSSAPFKALLDPAKFKECPDTTLSTYGCLTPPDVGTGKTFATYSEGFTDVKYKLASASVLDVSVQATNNMYDIHTALVPGDTDIGQFAIMAILTDADDGYLHFSGGVISGTMTATEPCGWIGKYQPFGTVGTIVGPYLATALAEAPSGSSKYIAEAWKYEMAVAKDQPLELMYGVAWHARLAADSLSGANRMEVSDGWLAPYMVSTPSSISSTNSVSVFSEDAVHAPAPAYWTIDPHPSNMSVESRALARCSLCWADATVRDGNLIPRSVTNLPWSFGSVTMTVQEIIAARALAYKLAFNSTSIDNATAGAGTTLYPGTPDAVLVPTLDTPIYASRTIAAFLGLDPATYGCVRTVREFFRRMYKRAEDLMRADG